ncbi:transporter [Tabrizicola sp. BL-A-41-H6]|uniref:transporter n=1 Tax=Tabrizicola sp. BL-A-41-H6 TaxID=3421107 RepID=UPI003D67F558
MGLATNIGPQILRDILTTRQTGAFATAVCAVAALQGTAVSAQSTDELARQLSNPVASLISVPFQGNFDFGGGEDGDGNAFTLNIQPVVPISLNDNWTLISRTILPLTYRDYAALPDSHVSGIGDITQSFFFSPKQSVNGVTWGVGPVFLLPTASDDRTGSGKWGAGLTAVVLKQTGPWTLGALVNHIWSVGGDDDRADISSTFLQPFMSYGLGDGQTLSLNTESSYNWETEQWLVPINAGYSKVFKAGNQLMSWQAGVKYFAEGPEGAPEWGLRTSLTLLFP